MGLFTKYILGIDPDKAMERVASGAKIVATMIDERNFTPEEASKAGLEFMRLNLDQNSIRSEIRRNLANLWARAYLALAALYILTSMAQAWIPRLSSAKEAELEVLKLLGTGTLMVLGFFFGTHLVRGLPGRGEKK